jgi:hypothetical protein
MKMFRHLLLALIAFTVVAGSVVPANAAAVTTGGTTVATESNFICSARQTRPRAGSF